MLTSICCQEWTSSKRSNRTTCTKYWSVPVDPGGLLLTPGLTKIPRTRQDPQNAKSVQPSSWRYVWNRLKGAELRLGESEQIRADTRWVMFRPPEVTALWTSARIWQGLNWTQWWKPPGNSAAQCRDMTTNNQRSHSFSENILHILQYILNISTTFIHSSRQWILFFKVM